MSWYSSHRSTTLHYAVSRALLYSVGYAVLSSSTQAATIGKTVVSSAQHKPLFASISVTDIRSKDFSIDMASTAIYQQMGMMPTDSMSVNFVPTSETTGQLIISTTQPVSKPFADLVLALNDGAQRTVIPKTLLMPLEGSLPIKVSNVASNKISKTPVVSTVISGARQPNLPVTSLSNAKPLTLRAGMPPPLLPIQTANLPTLATTSRMSSAVSAPKVDNVLGSTSAINTYPDSETKTTVNRSVTSNPVNRSAASALTIDSADKNILANEPFIADKIATATDNTAQLGTSESANNTSLIVSNNVAPDTGSSLRLDTLSIQVTRQIQPSSAVIATKAAIDTSKTLSEPLSLGSEAVFSKALSATRTAATATATATATSYTVQPNDNLWIISQQIAEQNNLSIKTVMTQIKEQNPNAFINKDAGQLRADAQLTLPDYDVVPSQQKLQAAIDAQRKYVQRAQKTKAKRRAPLQPNTETTQIVGRQNEPASIKKLPKARFSVVAPGRDGSADGTQTKASAEAGNGLNTDILSTLKATRQSTADQAQSLVDTNSTLSSYTQKIQLQNQKLAALQARLKELRDQ
ncbi:type IV pilus assembly protein FimV [Psychrobacter sp. T6-1]|uniref:type IV pilus assembly protein FimV n=1 Tax=Psychrobacter sp. T6-1 TaxID=3457447 RepID=UPI003FD61033